MEGGRFNTLKESSNVLGNKAVRALSGMIRNRVTLLSTMVVVPGVALSAPISPVVASSLLVGGSLGLCLTNWGAGTQSLYEDTLAHIEKHGFIDSLFFKRALLGDRYDCLGYCELQGMYLAAKELGLEDQFKELRKEYTTNKIPNF